MDFDLAIARMSCLQFAIFFAKIYKSKYDLIRYGADAWLFYFFLFFFVFFLFFVLNLEYLFEQIFCFACMLKCLHVIRLRCNHLNDWRKYPKLKRNKPKPKWNSIHRKNCNNIQLCSLNSNFVVVVVFWIGSYAKMIIC